MPVSSYRNQFLHTAPDHLRPYLFHGVDLATRGSHAVGDCPFCGREGKFSVDVSTGLWRCFVCGSGTDAGGGNGLVFIRLLYERVAFGIAQDAVSPAVGGVPAPARNNGARAACAILEAFYAAVAKDRGLADPATAAAWGVAAARDGAWLVPGYGTDGRLDQVYRRVQIQDGGKWSWRLLPTPGVWAEGKVHSLHLPVDDFDPARPNIVICEGPWDAMALWEVWDRGAENTNIVAVPGCNVWRDEWTEMCRGKCVTLMFDSDHPRVVSGRTFRAGYDGMVRITKRLSGAAASVRWLRWGPEGWDESKPSGWDVRDELIGWDTEPVRRAALNQLLLKVEDAPREWFSPSSPSSNGQAHTRGVESASCSEWVTCRDAWADAMQWRKDLSDALAVLLAVCASTQQAGNQLFLQLIGSAGSGKTTLCDGLLVSTHCYHLEHLTGFFSGWKKPGEDGKDCSLIARINGKTLITPEADVLVSSPRFREVMSQQRRIFDGRSNATYKNLDVDRVYEGLRTPWIMAGTPAMMDYDQSHLGDRFLRMIIDDPSEVERRAILRRAARSEREAILDAVNGTGSVVDSKTRRAHALTGGYVDWLRARVEEKLTQISISEDAEEYCIDLAELSADLRARPNEDKTKTETYDVKELPTRLARQNIRLASCLAVVLNKCEVDSEVLSIVRRVALDTAVGHSLNIVRWMCSPNPKSNYRLYQECGGLTQQSLEMWTGMGAERMKKYLNFLRKIDVLQWREIRQSHGAWMLTDRVYDLYLRVARR